MSASVSIMKPSLWDLKQELILEHKEDEKIIMKPSLWDLKLVDGNGNKLLALLSWNHPYGIWNEYAINARVKYFHHETIPMGFETYAAAQVSAQVRSWNHPYGIWNKAGYDSVERDGGASWNHPYGIWN